MLCPIKVNSNTIELTAHTSCYCVLDLLCVTLSFVWPALSHNFWYDLLGLSCLCLSEVVVVWVWVFVCNKETEGMDNEISGVVTLV